MAIDYSVLALPKHRPQSLEQETKRSRKQSALDKCYEKVDARDGLVCQVTGVTLKADHPDPKLRLTRDHLGPRSTHPEERSNVDNVITVSDYVHGFLTASALYPIDKHGEETIRVSKIFGWRWNERMFTEKRRPPFRLPKDRVA